MRRITAIALVILLAAAFAGGCSKEPAEGGASGIDDGAYAGYHYAGDVITGGNDLYKVNAKSASVSGNADDIDITLEFSTGSAISDGSTEGKLEVVPSYSVYLLEMPARLVIEFDSLSYWDYERTFDANGFELIAGCFRQELKSSNMAALYFNLTENVVFDVSENSNSLTVSLRRIKAAQETNDNASTVIELPVSDMYFVVADEYREYCLGTISREMDMQPTLSSDLSTILLISEPFASQAEAEAYMTSTLDLTEGAIAENWSVIKLDENERPTTDNTQLYAAAAEEKAVRIDGVETAPRLIIADGLMLTLTPDGNSIVYAKRMTSSETDIEAYSYQQVYVMDAAGNTKRLLRFEFETVEQAMYSPDGRRLAILERAAESTHLYIFDVDSQELLTDLTEMGFGDMISCFTWDLTGSIVYAVSGNDEMQIHSYDFNVPTENRRHTVVDKNGADEGSIAYAGGELYFCQSSLEGGQKIYRIKPEGGVRKVFTDGGSFIMSDDSRYLAVTVSGDDFATGGGSTFCIYDMTTGDTVTVTDDFSVYSYFWSPDGTKLYYFENRLAVTGEGASSGDSDETEAEIAETDPYPYTLWVYDAASAETSVIADFPTTSVTAGNGCLYVSYTDAQTSGERICATYIIDITDDQ